MKWQLRLLPIYGSALLMAASFAAAQPDKKGNPVDQGNYYPLQVGNRWEYRVDVAGSSAKAISSIVKFEPVEGAYLARLEAKVNDIAVASEHLRSDDKGIFRVRNNTQEISPPICLLKYPVRSGDRWEGDITVGKEKGKYSCETREETIDVPAGRIKNVDVPAGKFKAMKVTVTLDAKGQKVSTSYWFVKDVGFVKQTVEAGELNINMELEKFDLVNGQK